MSDCEVGKPEPDDEPSDEKLVKNIRNYKYRGGSWDTLNDACDAVQERLESLRAEDEKSHDDGVYWLQRSVQLDKENHQLKVKMAKLKRSFQYIICEEGFSEDPHSMKVELQLHRKRAKQALALFPDNSDK